MRRKRMTWIKKLLFLQAILIGLATAAAAGDIFEAAKKGDLEAVKKILAAHPELANAKDKNHRFVETVLHKASGAGHKAVVALLIEEGADVNAGDIDDSTSLDVAAQRGHTAVVAFLVKKGAAVNHADRNGMTPLHFASYEGHTKAAGILIAVGAKVNARTQGNSLPLHGAASGGHVDLCRMLIDEGSELETINDFGYPPILSAAAGGCEEIVKLLADGGADLEAKTTNGRNALILACEARRNQSPTLIAYLIRNGLDVNARSFDGQSPLMVAIWGENSDVIRTLIESGADVNAVDHYNRTPIMAAAHRGNRDLIRLLVKAGAEVNVADRDGTTPLINLSIQGSDDAAKTLLKAGADTDLQDDNWERTALHWAAVKGNANLTAALLHQGADSCKEDVSGDTPLCLAHRYGHRDVAALLTSGKAACDGFTAPDNAPFLTKRIAEKEAVLWYLGHCGWAIRTKNHFLLFDYWNKGKNPSAPALVNGHINPAEIAGQNVEVFVTHEHGDHFDETIFEWAKGVKNISYICGFEPGKLPRYAGTGYTGPACEYTEPRSKRKIDGMEIVTTRANDAGVGFLIKVDGLTIYHAGDHAGWRDGERDGFMKEIDFLAGQTDHVDFAFINITGCHAHDPSRLKAGNAYTLEKLNPVVTVPTHALDNEYKYTRFAEVAEARELPTKVIAPLNRGDRFQYRKTGIERALAD
jgi:ankyrin repeat protein